MVLGCGFIILSIIDTKGVILSSLIFGLVIKIQAKGKSSFSGAVQFGMDKFSTKLAIIFECLYLK